MIYLIKRRKFLLVPTVLTSCLLAGISHAQSITLNGDTAPVAGNYGATYSTGAMTVGNTGVGTLDVLSGGVLTNTNQTFIASLAGSSGTVSISGGTSQWNAADISLGRRGVGVLNISNGAKVISRQGYIGHFAGGVGTAIVDGPGSSWSIPVAYDVDFWIGQNGASGTLKILNGGTASTTSDIYTGLGTNSSAQIEVDGQNSALTAGALCYLGMTDTSTMQITNGGFFSCGSTSFLAFGSVSLNGPGSKWKLGSTLDIGNSTNLSNAVLSIGEGSSVEVTGRLALPNIFNAANNGVGALNIEGATSPGTLSAPSVIFGNNGLGSINFKHTDTSGSYLFTTPVTGPGTVTVSGGGFTNLTGNNVYTGTTSVDAGVLRAGSATGLSSASDFVVGSGGTLDTNTFNPTLKSLANNGTITMLAGGTTGILTVTNDYVANNGFVEINTALGDSSSATERLVINGNSSGATTLNISNLGGTGAQTTGDGILVVQVAGASNGTFSLPVPGYINVGGFSYSLAKVGNNWYLQSVVRALPPEASVACVPAALTDSENQISTCTVSLSTASAEALSINLNVPAASPRYTTSCVSPIVIAANSTQATCTITAVSNTIPGDGDVTADISIAPPTVADSYSAVGPASQVIIADDDTTIPPGAPTPVPTLGTVGLLLLSALLGMLGLSRGRKRSV